MAITLYYNFNSLVISMTKFKVISMIIFILFMVKSMDCINQIMVKLILFMIKFKVILK